MGKNRWITYILLLLVLLSCVGCGKTENVDTEQTGQTETTEQITKATETDAEKPTMDEEGFYIADDYVMTTAENVSARIEPDTNADIYKLLETGTVLKRTGYNDEWVRVIVDGSVFYAHAEYVTETDAPVASEQDATESDAEDDEEDGVQDKNTVRKIVIDPGKQSTLNVSLEQIGPDSEETKQGVSTGIIGANYGTREPELNLALAKLLQEELSKRGYEVVLTRDSDDVDITNKERAELANEEEADIFVRIQMTESTNSELSGILAVCMTENNPYNGGLYEDSRALATRLLQGVTEQTDAYNRGIIETDDFTAINWCNMPSAVINLGYLSNEADEKELSDVEYQKKLVEGLANGIDYYFK